ncbi:MAG: ATP-binding protein [Myxococcales bacterium]|nr:ATP-binding protein [Myxococcales bacterium]
MTATKTSLDFSGTVELLERLRREGAPRAEPAPSTFGCAKCDLLGIEILRPHRSDYLTAQRCACATGRCAECEGTGSLHYEVDGYRHARPCRCALLDRKIRWWRDACVPGKYLLAELKASYCRPGTRHSAHVESAAQAAIALTRGFQPGRRGIGLFGPVGTGKTHLLAAVVRDLVIRLGVRARFVEFTHLLSELKAAFGQAGGEAAIIDPLVEVPVLVIDELGKGRPDSEWVGQVLDQLITRRYSANRTTCFTTNFPIEAPQVRPGEPRPELLEDRVGARIMSRLHEMVAFYPVYGPDKRKGTPCSKSPRQAARVGDHRAGAPVEADRVVGAHGVPVAAGGVGE